MLERALARWRVLVRWVRRVERRELKSLRRWLEHTGNLVHLSVLVFVPLLMGLVTYLSNTLELVSFLLFPPLASATFTLFADPEGRYADPWTFVAGLTAGGLSGWVALEISARVLWNIPPGQFEVHAASAALSVFLTGVVTWGFDLEVPSAFSSALLVLVTGTSQLTYVLGMGLSATIVAAAFVVWRERVYERRATYLYQTTTGDDHVLVPLRGEASGPVAAVGARLAAAHDAGKVVLLDLIEDGQRDPDERTAPAADAGAAHTEQAGTTTDDADDEGVSDTAREAAGRLERWADRITERFGVPCEIVVATAGGDEGQAVVQTAREKNCDLVVAPHDSADHGDPYLRTLFGSSVDVLAFHAHTDQSRWDRVLVPVRRAGDVAHAMLDFARRLVGDEGTVAVCHCIDRERERRPAETMLANLVETFDGHFETRVAKRPVPAFIEANAATHDLVLLGASTDRSAASRAVLPPTVEQIGDIDADIGVVHLG